MFRHRAAPNIALHGRWLARYGADIRCQRWLSLWDGWAWHVRLILYSRGLWAWFDIALGEHFAVKTGAVPFLQK